MFTSREYVPVSKFKILPDLFCYTGCFKNIAFSTCFLNFKYDNNLLEEYIVYTLRRQIVHASLVQYLKVNKQSPYFF